MPRNLRQMMRWRPADMYEHACFPARLNIRSTSLEVNCPSNTSCFSVVRFSTSRARTILRATALFK
ncbi:hypothetical protein HETIRDRAFT_165327 [Heterobasidion irregulare TC 32-1]|uniref:Uncharacterized protein n=1 Tax=Heterobasidion irregulare (strain TC 32-1) TaxID=747525 RepID=W4K9V4_HETIT|nr:uncharacterized protein HETIRDRAFT_165327 [Heterobasidion irregulare TC 32-1]ETW82534.1 hypothetical protein HETIRDRAFT_165327 [Heterobasidion irregulare TC 32-1]